MAISRDMLFCIKAFLHDICHKSRELKERKIDLVFSYNNLLSDH